MAEKVSERIGVEEVRRALEAAGDPDVAAQAHRYFKAGPGEYGEGDRFRGLRVPAVREFVKEFGDRLSLESTIELLHGAFHEDRLLALLVLVKKYGKGKRGDEELRRKIYELYLKNTRHINNWDLVDSSAEHIVGAYLFERDKEPLFHLARSKSLWERRISILATLHFIKKESYDTTLELAELLLEDREDLIHKGVGWMLREIGERDVEAEKMFLREHCRRMPRTMLRYAIEKFPEEERQRFLRGEV